MPAVAVDDRILERFGGQRLAMHHPGLPGRPAELADPAKQRVTPDPYHAGENLIEQVDGHWIEKAQYFEAVAVTGEGVFDTLKAVSKLVLKSLA